MKNKLLVILLSICAATATIGLTACNGGGGGDSGNPGDSCAHEILNTVQEAKTATCEEDGYFEVTQCASCGILFIEEKGMKYDDFKQAMHDARIPGGHDIEYVEESVPSNCDSTGVIAHYKCNKCEKLFADAEGDEELQLSEITIPAGHNLNYVGELSATCTSTGVESHYECTSCGKLFDTFDTSVEVTLEDITIEKDPHNFTYTCEANEATCLNQGNVAFWYCSDCYKYYGDEEGTVELVYEDIWSPQLQHEYTNVEVVREAGCDYNEIKKYSCVNGCDEDYWNHSYEIETEGTMLGHNFVGGVCQNCECDEFTQGLYIYTEGWGDDTYAAVSGFGEWDGVGVLTIPESYQGYPVKRVSLTSYAFDNVTKVIIPETVTSISLKNDSYEISQLTEIIIKSSELDSISIQYFAKLTDVTFTNEDCVIHELGYFNNLESIETLTLKGDYTEIKGQTFLNNYKLKNLTLSENVTEIKYSAFEDCNELESIPYFSELETIGSNAFKNCSSLEEIYLPSSVTTIIGEAFYGCTALEKVIVDDVKDFAKIGFNTNYSSSSTTVTANPLYYAHWLYKKTANGVEPYGDIVLGEDVYGEDYESTTIGAWSFAGCYNITKIVVPTGITTIGEQAFLNNERLTEVEFHDKTQRNGSHTLTTLGKSAFEGCYLLESVTLAVTLNNFGSDAFKGCESIETVNYNDVYWTTPEWLAKRFNNLYANPMWAGNATLYGAQNTIPYSYAEVASISLDPLSGLQETYEAREAVTVPAYAFAGMSARIDGFEYVTSIGDGAFYNAAGVNGQIWLNQYVSGEPHVGRPSNFRGCTSIGDEAFYGCYNLDLVSLSSYLTEIGDRAFAYSGLQHFGVTNSSITFGEDILIGCEDITYFEVPYLRRTSSSSNDRGLQYFFGEKVPESLTSIRLHGNIYSNDLAGATGLRAIYVDRNTTLAQGTFGSNVITKGLNVFYDGSLKDYINNQVHLIDNSSTLSGANLYTEEPYVQNNRTYYETKLVKDLVIPEGVTSILSYKFAGFTSIETVTIPLDTSLNLSNIGSNAFAGCTNLLEVFHLRNDNTTPLTVGSTNYGCIAQNAHAIYTVAAADRRVIRTEDGFIFAMSASIPKTATLVKYVGEGGDVTLPSVFIDYDDNNDGKIDRFDRIDPNDPDSAYPNGGVKFQNYNVYSRAFVNNKSITSVTFPVNELGKSTVKSIGISAFDGCSNLKSVTFQEGLLEIRDYAFRNTALQTVVIPDSVTDLGTYDVYYGVNSCSPFDGCNELYQIVIGANCNYVKYLAEDRLVEIVDKSGNFIGKTDTGADIIHKGPSKIFLEGDYAFLRDGEELTLIAYVGNATELSLPELGEDYVIGKKFLYGNSTVTKIIISDDVVEVGEEAFNSTNVQEIVMGSGLKVIGKSAFAYNEDLTVLEFGENVEYIDTHAFYSTGAIEEVVLPATVNYIGTYAFVDTGIKKLVFAEGFAPANVSDAIFSLDELEEFHVASLKEYLSLDLANYYIFEDNYEVARLYVGGEQVTELNITAEDCDYIPNYAFYRLQGIDKITIEGIDYIGENAFTNTSATEIVIKDVERIGRLAFASYYGGSESKTESVVLENVQYIEEYAFDENNYLTSLTMSGVVEIGSYAFSGSQLRELTIPSTVKIIGDGVFTHDMDYVTFRTVVLPEGLEELGRGFANVQTTEYNGGYYLGTATNPYYALVDVEMNISTITLHPDTKIAAGYSLANTNDYISEVNLNEGLISIGSYVLGGAGKGSLTSITLPSTLKYISSNAFRSLSLESIVIPANVERIGEYAFYYCNSLSSVTFEENCKVEVIEGYTFASCHNITTITIPDNVKVIKAYAFSNISTLTLGNSVEYIEISAFNHYSGSLSAVYAPSIEAWLNIEFSDAFHSDATIYVDGEVLTEVIVPESITVIHKYAFSGNDNIVSFVGSSTLETIEESAFYNCQSLESVDLGGAKYVAENAFYQCYDLTEITASNVITIGEGAFMGVSAITELTLGSSLLEVGESAFGQYRANMADEANVYFEGSADDWAKINFANMYSSPLGCSSDYTINFYLNGEQPTEITLSTETIGNFAFYRVPYIVSVTLEDTVKTIGQAAFAECSALTTVTMNGVETIGESAFAEDSQITSITGFDTVKNIGLQAFYSVSIDNLDLSSIETIAEQAFYYATISSMNVGSNLVSIGRDAFSHASGNYSLDFEFALEELASKTFESEFANPAYYASSVTFNGEAAPETVTLTMAEIKPYAYAGVQFINLVLDGVETVGNGAFYKNNQLVSVEMSDSVITLGSSAFYNCTHLANVTFSNSLTEIMPYTFVNTNIVDVVLSDSIKVVNYKAFTYSGYNVTPTIKSIHLGKEFKEFGESSYGGYTFFGDNYKVTEVTLDEENTNFVIEDGVLYNANKTVLIYCFDKTKTIFEIPEGVTTIKESAFREMKSLTVLTLPSTLTEIEDDAFLDCNKLVEIINKSNLAIRANQNDYNNGYVGYYSISVVKSADEAIYSVDEEGFVTMSINGAKTLIGYAGEATSFVIPYDVSRIYKYAFYGLELESLVIENPDIQYDSNAFNGLKVINLTVPAGALSALDLSVEELTISGGTISNSLGSYNKLKSSVKTLTICEDASFYENNTNNPFQYFKALQTLNIYCSYIKINAFSNCTALETINLGENVTRIGSGAFYQCSAIKTVNYSGTINDWASIGFNDGTAYNGAGYTPLYYGADLYIDGVLVEGEVTIDVATVKAHAFYNYDRINAVILSDNVITVESSAFADMEHLTHVTVGKNVTTIGTYAFDCDKIVDIYNRSSLAIVAHTIGNNKDFGRLGYNALNVYTVSSGKKIAYDNNGFATLNYGDRVVLVDYYGEAADIVVPSNVTEILECAFYRFSATYLEDPSVATITIPSSVTYVHKEAFTYAQFASIIFEEKTGWYTVERYTNNISVGTIDGNVEEQVGGSSDSNYFHDIQRLSNENGCLIRQEGNLKYLVKYVGTLDFDENGKFTIVVPEGVTDIGYCAFAYLGNASEEVSISIVMPNSLKRIEKNAFYWHNGHCCIDEIDLQNNNSGWYKSETGYSNGSYMSGDFGDPVTAATVFAQTRENTYKYYFYRT